MSVRVAEGAHDVVPAGIGSGTHEAVADPMRPLVYRISPQGQYLTFLNASTGQLLESVVVGPSPTSIDFSDDGNSLYIAVSGANQIAVLDIDTRTVVRTTDLGFSPLSVRDGRPDRLYVSGTGDSLVRVVSETTGAVIATVEPNPLFEALVEASPDGDELLVYTRSWPVKMYRYSIVADDPVLLASDNHDLQGDAEKVIVDWSARIVYFNSMYQYGVKLISLDTLRGIQDFVTYAYPVGVALLASRHLVFGLQSYPYGAALWAFNTSDGSLVRKVPLAPELEFVVASEPAETVLVWSQSGVYAFPLSPAVAPREPAPGAHLSYVPQAVEAIVWTGIPETTIDRGEVTVNGRPLTPYRPSPDRLIGVVSPPTEVGLWNVTAEILWSGRSSITRWSFTVDPPPPVARFDTHPRDPLFVGQTIEFDASGSSAPMGTIVAYDWEFGDGSSGTGPTASRSYGQPGAYSVTLRVTTDIGSSDTEVQTLAIQSLPDVRLEPYSYPGGFAIPIPAAWSLSTDVTIDGSLVEVVLEGPDYGGTRTGIAVDMVREPRVEETPAFLDDWVDRALADFRDTWPALVVTEPAAPRTIAGHAGIVFTVFDPPSDVAMEVALVVSEPHRGYWTIVLVVAGPYLFAHDSMFEAMVRGFEITAGLPSGPDEPIALGVAVAAAGVAGAVAAGVGWWVLRFRSARRGTSPEAEPPGKAPPS